ncbi:glycosyltransferase family 4 protein [Algoriphagus limi]|uniref:Glycosyltransferase family 4 protein n=1 Tax=Algoriphagus limi TaxID=2975273 RepID=A0ABT2G1M1_9BACT|nr:glycosyltransferase family 1 protein [Algoriphagus limi]MCS5489169.1 glycosyltransferase family 4 protein [Algoriphagus limi]
MRILFDEQIFFWQKYGGISRYYARTAEELKKVNPDTKVFSGFNINTYLSDTSKGLVVGKTLQKYPKKGLGLIQRFNQTWSRTFESYYGPDIVHETYFSTKKSHRSKAKVVVGVYDMIQEVYPNLFPKEHLVTVQKKKALERADHIISISHHTKNDCVELFGINENKISVIHLACDPPFQGIEKSQEFSDRPFFLYVGDRRGYKNFTSFLSVFACSKELMNGFNIVAFGGGAFSKEETDLMVKLGFRPDQVKQYGGSDRVLAELYASAHAFVYPSLYEGFGIPPLEAISYGCPVLASNKSCIPEIIQDGGLLFDPENQEEFLAALKEVCTSESKRKNLIEKGNKRLKNFSWSKTADQTLKIYNQII